MKVKILITLLALFFNTSVNVFGEDVPRNSCNLASGSS